MEEELWYSWKSVLLMLGDRLAAIEYIRGLCANVWELGEQMQWVKIMAIPKLLSSADDDAHCQSIFKAGSGYSYKRAVFYKLMVPVLIEEWW